MKQIPSIPHVNALTLSDRADGVRGRYCVGFTDANGTRWHWNHCDGGSFNAFGTLIVGEDAANALLNALRRAHNFYSAGKTTIDGLNARIHDLENLLSEATNETHDYMCKLETANNRVAELEQANTEVRIALGQRLKQLSELHDELAQLSI